MKKSKIIAITTALGELESQKLFIIQNLDYKYEKTLTATKLMTERVYTHIFN